MALILMLFLEIFVTIILLRGLFYLGLGQCLGVVLKKNQNKTLVSIIFIIYFITAFVSCIYLYDHGYYSGLIVYCIFKLMSLVSIFSGPGGPGDNEPGPAYWIITRINRSLNKVTTLHKYKLVLEFSPSCSVVGVDNYINLIGSCINEKLSVGLQYRTANEFFDIDVSGFDYKLGVFLHSNNKSQHTIFFRPLEEGWQDLEIEFICDGVVCGKYKERMNVQKAFYGYPVCTVLYFTLHLLIYLALALLANFIIKLFKL